MTVIIKVSDDVGRYIAKAAEQRDMTQEAWLEKHFKHAREISNATIDTYHPKVLQDLIWHGEIIAHPEHVRAANASPDLGEQVVIPDALGDDYTLPPPSTPAEPVDDKQEQSP